AVRLAAVRQHPGLALGTVLAAGPARVQRQPAPAQRWRDDAAGNLAVLGTPGSECTFPRDLPACGIVPGKCTLTPVFRVAPRHALEAGEQAVGAVAAARGDFGHRQFRSPELDH